MSKKHTKQKSTNLQKPIPQIISHSSQYVEAVSSSNYHSGLNAYRRDQNSALPPSASSLIHSVINPSSPRPKNFTYATCTGVYSFEYQIAVEDICRRLFSIGPNTEFLQVGKIDRRFYNYLDVDETFNRTLNREEALNHPFWLAICGQQRTLNDLVNFSFRKNEPSMEIKSPNEFGKIAYVALHLIYPVYAELITDLKQPVHFPKI